MTFNKKAWRLKNKEYLKQKRKEWRLKNKEHLKRYRKSLGIFRSTIFVR